MSRRHHKISKPEEEWTQELERKFKNSKSTDGPSLPLPSSLRPQKYYQNQKWLTQTDDTKETAGTLFWFFASLVMFLINVATFVMLLLMQVYVYFIDREQLVLIFGSSEITNYNCAIGDPLVFMCAAIQLSSLGFHVWILQLERDREI